ncbi:pentapeptide repeat-containing protein [Nostoc linckia FACHB-104]|nr:pentapeptide repeat-containing protein [Nostoc linckia FACHB-104]
MFIRKGLDIALKIVTFVGAIAGAGIVVIFGNTATALKGLFNYSNLFKKEVEKAGVQIPIQDSIVITEETQKALQVIQERIQGEFIEATKPLAVAWFGFIALLVFVSVAGVIVGTFSLTAAIAVAVNITEAFTIVAVGISIPFVIIAVETEKINRILLDITMGPILQESVSYLVTLSSNAWILLGIYLSWRSLSGYKNFILIQKFSIAIATIGGTNFHRANLVDADFTYAVLKNTNFTAANVTRTCWLNTKKLDLARVDQTYLDNSQVRKLLITGEGQGKSFDYLFLRGIYLRGVNLAEASFIGADLSEASLQDANLSRVKLKQTQLDGTDFTGACLTGAYIEDWGITSDTNFDGVRCEYVYMHLPTKENPDPLRKPDNNKEVFSDGEFGDFIKPIVDTLDLYHNQGVDPRAIAISFKELAENHPDAELEIVAMEKRGEDKFLLRAKTAATANKSQLSAEYFEIYNQLKSLAEQELKALIAEKDSRIRSLETMVMTALERPSFYSNIQVEEVGTMTNNPGGFSIGGSVGGNVNNVQGDNNRAVQGDNNQAVLGDNNQVTQQNQVGADSSESLTKEDVVKLLAQLETLIKGAEIPADTKEEIVEDLSAAKKATDKEEPNKQRALDRLGTVAETLEKTSKTVESGHKIWATAKPIIMKVAAWLGAAAGSHLLGL